MDYFEIFLERMLLCRRAAEFLELTFKLDINGLSCCQTHRPWRTLLLCSKNSRDSTTPRPSIVTGGLPFDLGFYHYTLPRTFYRFYHAVEQQNGKFLCFTVSCNKSALGFRLRRTSPRRSSLCASHFIESVGNECKLGTSGIRSSYTLWSEKNELSQPWGSPLSFSV